MGSYPTASYDTSSRRAGTGTGILVPVVVIVSIVLLFAMTYGIHLLIDG